MLFNVLLLHTSLETISLEGYIYTLERMQRRVTKIIPELRDFSYEERLRECVLTTIERMRLEEMKLKFF